MTIDELEAVVRAELSAVAAHAFITGDFKALTARMNRATERIIQAASQFDDIDLITKRRAELLRALR